MLPALTKRLAASFVRSGLMRHDLEEWCRYWLEKTILNIIAIFAMLLSAGFVFGFPVTCFFLIGLLPLRRRLVGYHTRSPVSCFFLSLFVAFAGLLVNRVIPDPVRWPVSVILFCFSMISVVFFLRAQNDPSLHLSEEEVKANHRLAVLCLLFASAAVLPFSLFLSNAAYFSACQIGILIVVLSAYYAKWKGVKS